MVAAANASCFGTVGAGMGTYAPDHGHGFPTTLPHLAGRGHRSLQGGEVREVEVDKLSRV